MTLVYLLVALLVSGVDSSPLLALARGGPRPTTPQVVAHLSAVAPPALGSTLSLLASSNRSLGVRQCNGVGAVTPIDSSGSDFGFAVAAAKNGNGASISLFNQNGGFLTASEGGRVVLTSNPSNSDDASWTLTPGLTPGDGMWTLVSSSKIPGLGGCVLSLNASSATSCGAAWAPASGDAACLPPGSPTARVQTFWAAPPMPGEQILGPASPADQPEWLAAWSAFRAAWRTDSGFTSAVYDLPTLAWNWGQFAQPMVPVYDKFLYNRTTHSWTVDALLDDFDARYGGVTGVLLWATFPDVGIDERNQFQLMGEDVPGGLAGLTSVVAAFHARGKVVGLAYNPWDTGTSRPNTTDDIAMATLAAAVGADFVNGDTMNLMPRAFFDSSVAAGRPLGLQSEMGPSLIGLPYMTMGNGYWGRPSVPAICPYKWVERKHSTTVSIQWWEIDRTIDIQSALFNGVGFNAQENVWGLWHAMTDRSAEGMRRAFSMMAFIFAQPAAYLASEGWEPHTALVPGAAAAGLYASRWPGATPGSGTAWTIVATGNNNFTGPAISIPCPPSPPDLLYFDLYAGMPLTPFPFASACALNLSFVEAQGYGAVLGLPTAAATGNATLTAFLAKMAAMTARPLASFYNDELWQGPNETMVAYTPTAKVSTTPAGMVHVPANPAWTFACNAAMYSNFDVQFPFESAPTTTHNAVLNVPAFHMDVSPVTNAQYAVFLNSSGYAPLDTHNFLRDWASPAAGPPSNWSAKPVTWVDLLDAAAYCAHYGKRLPNDWEWQYAFQGTANTTYPWGNAFNASCAPAQTHDNVRPPPPDVGGYPSSCASPFGVQDGMGLVWQWTNEFQDFRNGVALIRGGSYWIAQGSDWYPKNNILDATTTTLRTHNMLRLMDASYDRHGTVGFRCVQDSV